MVAGDLGLPCGRVQLWAGELTAGTAQLELFQHFLSSEEQNRVAGFRRDQDRRRFIVGHGLLRILLGRYLDRDPASLGFRIGPFGKPWLGEPEHTGLRFNLAHSGNQILIAVAPDREVGVDVEQVQQVPELESIADRFFSPAERGILRALPPPTRLRDFFRCWTFKEAYLKGLGVGLSGKLTELECPLQLSRMKASIEVTTGTGPRQSWSIREVDSPSGYAAAVAASGDDWEIEQRVWPSWSTSLA